MDAPLEHGDEAAVAEDGLEAVAGGEELVAADVLGDVDRLPPGRLVFAGAAVDFGADRQGLLQALLVRPREDGSAELPLGHWDWYQEDAALPDPEADIYWLAWLR